MPTLDPSHISTQQLVPSDRVWSEIYISFKYRSLTREIHFKWRAVLITLEFFHDIMRRTHIMTLWKAVGVYGLIAKQYGPVSGPHYRLVCYFFRAAYRYRKHTQVLPGITDFAHLDLWWRCQIETFSALLAFCEGDPSVTGGFPSLGPVTRSFDVVFDLRLNKRLSKHQDACDLRRIPAHYDVTVM